MKGYITAKDEWLYPDTVVGELQGEVELHMAANGRENIQILFCTEEQENIVEVEQAESFDVERYEMLPVKVKYNDTDTEEQSGMFVITEKEYETPPYCTRKAPFEVYDALKPVYDGKFHAGEGRCAVCISIGGKEGCAPGKYDIKIYINGQAVAVRVCVYGVDIPAETLKVTNWFSLKNISLWHNVPPASKQYYSMVRIYAKKMRRLRQTHFFIMLEYADIKCDFETGEFDFSGIKPVIDIFFEEGFTTMEFGNLACKYDVYRKDEMRCSLERSVKIGSDRGYLQMQRFIKAVADFLYENGWQNRTVFHIADEPDVHLAQPEKLDARKRDYFRLALLLKRYIPESRIIEAVKTTEFKGAVDIMVPLTTSYEQYRKDFDELKAAGEEIWCYVCCVPTGRYLNRFLDINLLRSRLLFWECSAYDLKGYLHWGLNMTPEDGYDPYEDSNVPNTEFHGIFPAGDAYILYPGEGEPYISNRFEAQRKGAEDFELLRILKEKEPERYESIVGKVFRSSSDFDDNTDKFEQLRREILKVLEDKTKK